MDVGTLLRRLPMRQRRRSRPRPDRSLTLTPILLDCPECRHRTYADYKNYRTISTLDSVFWLTLTIRRCPNPECSRFLRPYRPEAESQLRLALSRVRTRRHGPGRPAPLCRAPQYPRDLPRTHRPGDRPRRAHRHQPLGPLR